MRRNKGRASEVLPNLMNMNWIQDEEEDTEEEILHFPDDPTVVHFPLCPDTNILERFQALGQNKLEVQFGVV